MKTFYSINEEGGTTYLLQQHHMTRVMNPDDADVLVFNGGADIGTEIYGESPVIRGVPQKTSYRDKEEVKLFERARQRGQFMLGICRGAQLLNCLNGGTLWQHVEDHQRDHGMVDLRTGERMRVTSTHHQMMRPGGGAELIGVSNICTYRVADGAEEEITPAENMQDGVDVEVVWYEDTRCLCIQGHPEYVPGSRFDQWSFELMREKYEAALAPA